MRGGSWHRIRVTPKVARKFKRSGKQTPGRRGGPGDAGKCRDQSGADHVPRRGALQTDGANPPLLSAIANASDGGQRLRTVVHRCLWCGWTGTRGTGLEDHREEEYRKHERLPDASQQGAPGRIHRYDR